MTLPKKLRVGFADYRVEPWQHTVAMGSQRYGECDHYERVIRIDDALDSTKSANTLLHELFHAIWTTYALENDDKEERVVTVLSNGLAQVWRDNPDLVKFLNKSLSA